MTDQLPRDDHDDHDDDDMVIWVRRAYGETPEPLPSAVEAAKAVARELVAQRGGEPLPIETVVDKAVYGDPASIGASLWRHRGRAGATLLAAAVVVAVWLGERGLPRRHDGSQDSAMAMGGSMRQSPALALPTDAPNTASTGNSGVASGTSVIPQGTSGSERIADAQPEGQPDVHRRGLSITPGTRGVGSSAAAPRMDSVIARGKVAPPTFASTVPGPVPPAMPSPHPVAPASVSPVVHGLDAESAMLVQQIMDSASVRGLPVTLLASRVREGVERGVPGPRIVVVTRRLAAALRDAKTALEALKGPASPLEVEAGAEALVAGAPVSALRQIRAARPAGGVTEPLLALTDMTAHGVAPLRASAALAVLAAHDPADGGIQALRAHVVSDILRGTSPDAALAGRMRQVTSANPSTNAVSPSATSPRAPSLPGGGATDSLLRQPGTP